MNKSDAAQRAELEHIRSVIANERKRGKSYEQIAEEVGLKSHASVGNFLKERVTPRQPTIDRFLDWVAKVDPAYRNQKRVDGLMKARMVVAEALEEIDTLIRSESTVGLVTHAAEFPTVTVPTAEQRAGSKRRARG